MKADPKQDRTDRFFIQEIMNDLARNRQTKGKAFSLLRDWSRELRDRSGLKGHTRRAFMQEVGKENW